jgi:hypothetical protein
MNVSRIALTILQKSTNGFAFHNTDLSIIFLQLQASKQHYSSISTLKQISLIDYQTMAQFSQVLPPTPTLFFELVFSHLVILKDPGNLCFMAL